MTALGEEVDSSDEPSAASKKTGWLRGLLDSQRLQLVRLLPGVNLPLTIVVAVTVLMGALLAPFAIVARGLLVGTIPATLRAGGLSSLAGQRTISALALVAAMFVANILVGRFSGVMANALGMALDRDLEQRVMRVLNAPVGLGHLEDPKTADRSALVQGVGSASYRPGNAVPGLTDRVQTWLSGLGAAILVAGFHWWVAVGLSAVFLWAARVTLRHYVMSSKTLAGQVPTLRRSAYYRDQAFIPATAKEIRVFDLSEWFLSRFRASWFDAMKPLWEDRGKNQPGLRRASLAMGITSFAAAAYVGWEAINGAFDIGRLAIFLGAIQGLFAFGQGYGPGDLQLQHGLTSLPVIRDLEEAADDQRALAGAPPSPTAPQHSIRLERVCFTYPGTEREVLSELDMEIPAGRSTAIVGVNGAGKTTLIKLLCRFYDPGSGQILIDEQRLDSLDARLWQRRIAAIFQDFIRYELSARENVGFGGVDHMIETNRLQRAAERAGAKRLIESLPKGWDTVLSRQVKDGVDISGGEWQRVALARALFSVEAGARVLILDEPTANLDVRAEAELYSTFLDMTRGSTTILISHRFSTVRRADLIYVVENGRVIEKGSHDQLIQLGGRYAHMFGLQAARFREPEPSEPS